MYYCAGLKPQIRKQQDLLQHRGIVRNFIDDAHVNAELQGSIENMYYVDNIMPVVVGFYQNHAKRQCLLPPQFGPEDIAQLLKDL